MSGDGSSQGHSSYLVWLIYEFRAISRILPNLKGKPKHAWAAPFALCVLVLIVTVGMGIYIDGYGVHPPAQYTGVCPPPAFVRGDSCLTAVVVTVVVSGTTTTKVIDQPAGHVILPNSTKG